MIEFGRNLVALFEKGKKRIEDVEKSETIGKLSHRYQLSRITFSCYDIFIMYGK